MAVGDGPRMTIPTQLVLRVMLANPDTPMYGLELGDKAELLPGTIHPILVRLKREGWVNSWKEDIDPRAVGRPARRYYQLTPLGITAATRALARTHTPRSLVERLQLPDMGTAIEGA